MSNYLTNSPLVPHRAARSGQKRGRDKSSPISLDFTGARKQSRLGQMLSAYGARTQSTTRAIWGMPFLQGSFVAASSAGLTHTVTLTAQVRGYAKTLPVAIGVGATFGEAEADALCGLAKLVVACVAPGAATGTRGALASLPIRARLSHPIRRKDMIAGACAELRKQSPTRLSDTEIRFLEKVAPGWNAPTKREDPESVWLTAKIEGRANRLSLMPQGASQLMLSDASVRKLLPKVDLTALERALQAGESVYCMAKVNIEGTRVLAISDVSIPEVAESVSDTKLTAAASVGD